MPSRRHQALAWVLALTHAHRMPHDEAGMAIELETATLRPRPFAPPRSLDRRVSLRVGGDHGWRVYEMVPRDRPRPQRTIVYFHGGGYVGEIDAGHWRLCRRLACEVPARVVVPIYPVAPGSTADETVPTAAAVVADVLADGGDPALTTLMGDSAGGGLALATAQALRDQGIGGIPLVLIAPWLDATMNDPALDPAATRDPILSVPRLRRAGELYAGRLPTDDPRVSPINGSFAGLGPITVYAGTRDLLVHDSRRLATLARAAGVTVEVHEAEGLVHVWPLLPVPEARGTRADMVRVVRQPPAEGSRTTTTERSAQS